MEIFWLWIDGIFSIVTITSIALIRQRANEKAQIRWIFISLTVYCIVIFLIWTNLFLQAKYTIYGAMLFSLLVTVFHNIIVGAVSMIFIIDFLQRAR